MFVVYLRGAVSRRRRLAGAERGSRFLHISLKFLCERVHAPEHASRGHGALLNETAWSALVGMRKRECREAAKAELAAE